VQLCVFKARLTKIEKWKDIKYEYENSRKLARNTQKTYSFSKFTCLFHEYGSREALDEKVLSLAFWL
jgi:hypothetical protein